MNLWKIDIKAVVFCGFLRMEENKREGKKINIEFNNSSVPSSRSNKSERSTESDRLKVHFLLPQTCDGV